MRHSIWLLLCVNGLLASNTILIDILNQTVPLSAKIKNDLYQLARHTKKNSANDDLFSNHSLPLYDAYPELSQSLPRVVLGDFPTPIKRLELLEKQYRHSAQVYLKCDDITGNIINGKRRFGGNKIRKLEFLLADAITKGARTVMTYGCCGSNHATATASCAQQLGLRCINLLKPQPKSDVVARNLLLMNEYNAELILNPSNAIRSLQTICSFVQNSYKHGGMPYLIPTGGSNALGAIGFVNAAFELKQQVQQDVLPEPDIIYAPLGSCGTVCGLLVGLKAAGLKSKIKAIAVEPAASFDAQINSLFYKINSLLRKLDSSFPVLELNKDDYDVLLNFAGNNYGEFTQEGNRATKIFHELQDVQLDGTYSAKAAAGMMHDLESGALQDKNVLFWHTFCGYIKPDNTDYSKLSKEFHSYFY